MIKKFLTSSNWLFVAIITRSIFGCTVMGQGPHVYPRTRERWDARCENFMWVLFRCGASANALRAWLMATKYYKRRLYTTIDRYQFNLVTRYLHTLRDPYILNWSPFTFNRTKSYTHIVTVSSVRTIPWHTCGHLLGFFLSTPSEALFFTGTTKDIKTWNWNKVRLPTKHRLWSEIRISWLFKSWEWWKLVVTVSSVTHHLLS